jgi:zinc D-Ala-D-Ala carboxypeptidase
MRPSRFLIIIALIGALFLAGWLLTGRRLQQWMPWASGSADSVAIDDAPDTVDDVPLASGANAGGKPGVPLTGEAAVAAAICRARGADASGAASLFGHIKHYDASAGSLVAPPAGFGGGNCSAVHRDMAGALSAMIAAADADSPGLGRAMVGISCHRSAKRQADLYCAAPRIAARGYAGQAFWVAPPGFSEHSTGRSIDFGDRAAPGCNVEPCFAGTAVGRWLASNAGRFGFAMSFPPGNAQGVAYEPWHFRYVGGWSGGASPAPESENGTDAGAPAPIDVAPATPAPPPAESPVSETIPPPA